MLSLESEACQRKPFETGRGCLALKYKCLLMSIFTAIGSQPTHCQSHTLPNGILIRSNTVNPELHTETDVRNICVREGNINIHISCLGEASGA